MPKQNQNKLKPSTYQTKSVLKPSNLNIRKLLADNPPMVAKCAGNIHQQADKIAILLHKIIKSTNLIKDNRSFSNNGYQPIHSKLLQGKVRDYDVYLNYLIDQNIIERDNRYIIGEQSKGYRFSEKYKYSRLSEHIMQIYNNARRGSIHKRINEINDSQRATINNYPELYEDILKVSTLQSDYLANYIYNKCSKLAQFSIKEDKPKRELSSITDEEIMQKLNSWYSALFNIQQGYLYFKQDNTGSRLHTSVLAVKKELRSLLKLNGKSIWSADLKNSQPYLSAYFFTPYGQHDTLMNIIEKKLYGIKKKDINLFKKIISKIKDFKKGNITESIGKYVKLVESGRFYEFVADKLGKELGKTLSRNDAKKITLKLLYEPPYKPTPTRKWFRSEFADVAILFEDINKHFTRSYKESIRRSLSKQTNYLAIILQTIESYLILDVSCKRIKKRNNKIPLLTLHDAIATNKDNIDIVKNIMIKTFHENIGIKPKVEIENWINTEDINNKGNRSNLTLC